MNHTSPSIRLNQLGAAAFVLMLSPALRFFPSAASQSAGRAAPLAALLALIPAALYLLGLRRLLARRAEGEGLCALIARALPGRAGRMALLALALWLSVYAGFILRSGADRFIVAVYPNTPGAFFIVTMALAALSAAAASYRSTARTAKLVLPAVGGTLALVLLFSLGSVRPENLALFPLSGRAFSFRGLARGIVDALDVLLWSMWAAALLLGELKKEERAPLRLLGVLLLGGAVLALLCASLIGSFGAPLTAKLSWPFFSLVRNLVFFRSIERIEALIVALWVFPDFLIVSLFLRSARDCLRQSLGKRVSLFAGPTPALLLCGGVSLAFALLAAPDAQRLETLSMTVIPAANLFFALVFFPAVLITGRVKRRL